MITEKLVGKSPVNQKESHESMTLSQLSMKFDTDWQVSVIYYAFKWFIYLGKVIKEHAYYVTCILPNQVQLYA